MGELIMATIKMQAVSGGVDVDVEKLGATVEQPALSSLAVSSCGVNRRVTRKPTEKLSRVLTGSLSLLLPLPNAFRPLTL